jgi:hypothetical protein
MKMSTTLALLISTFSTISSFGDNLTIVCGNDHAKISVLARRADVLSTPVVTGFLVDGQTVKYRQASVSGQTFEINNFGYSGYENIKITVASCNDGKSIVGKADYNHYDSSKPYNPMQNAVLNCICTTK